MKKIICAALALTLLGSTAAEARGWGHGGWHGGYHHGWGGGAFLGLGLGLLALGAVAAHEDRERYYDREDYYRDGPPRGYDDRYGPPPRDRDYRDAPPRDRDSYRGDDRGGYRNDDRSGARNDDNRPGDADRGPRDLHDDNDD
jgi:hypothetical protein